MVHCSRKPPPRAPGKESEERLCKQCPEGSRISRIAIVGIEQQGINYRYVGGIGAVGKQARLHVRWHGAQLAGDCRQRGFLALHKQKAVADLEKVIARRHVLDDDVVGGHLLDAGVQHLLASNGDVGRRNRLIVVGCLFGRIQIGRGCRRWSVEEHLPVGAVCGKDPGHDGRYHEEEYNLANRLFASGVLDPCRHGMESITDREGYSIFLLFGCDQVSAFYAEAEKSSLTWQNYPLTTLE